MKSRLIGIARSHLAITVDDEQKTEREKRLGPLLEALSASVFRMVIMGEVKKGKSSFINALLGQADLLPMATDIATSTVYKIVYGSTEKFTVFFLPPDDDAGPELAPLQIQRDQLADFGTEDGNPGNVKSVDFIAIEFPHPLLSEGIVIVDTPGVGGLFKRHRDITFRYAPQADVVFFVLDSVEAVISDDEVKFLQELQKNTQQIVFLQTKIDIAGTEQIEAWKSRNLEILSKVLSVDAEQIPYFLVGAKLKQRADKLRSAECLQESGYLAVLDYLRQNLLPRRDEILTRRWYPALGPELLSAGKLVADRLAIVRESHQPQMAVYESQLADAEREFERWQTDVWPDQYRTFQDVTGRLKRETKNRLQDDLSSESHECQANIEELRANCRTADEVNALGDQLLAAWAARWNGDATSTLDAFHRDYLQQVESLVGKMATDLNAISIPELKIESVERRVDSADQMAAIREAAMNSNVFGGFAGEAAKWTGYGAGIATALGVLTAPLGLVIGAAAGVGYLATRIWTAVRGYNAAHERQRDAAVASFERALIKTGNIAIRGALRIFEGLAADLDAASRAKVDAFRSQTKHEFTVRRQEIIQAKTRTVSEAKAAEDQLKNALARYQELVKQYQELKRQLDAGATPA